MKNHGIEPYSLLNQISAGLQAVLLLSSVAISISLLWLAAEIDNQTAQEIVNAIATGLLVSASFGIAQAFVTGRATSELLRSAVVNEVSTSLAASHESYFPTHEFPPSFAPNPDFNFLINKDLSESSVVWFQGGSGQYAAARLMQNRGVNLQINIILPDPRIEGSLDGRADHSYRHNLFPNATIEEIREITHQNLSMGFVGLCEARDKCSDIKVILTPMPSLDRYEIFRNSIWVTLFSDNGTGSKFPKTLRFGSGSVVYCIQEADCLQAKHSPVSRIIDIPRRMSIDTKIHLYNQVFGTEVSKQEFEELRTKFIEFAKKFIERYNALQK